MYINNQSFEWDERKALLNLAKHGIEFRLAAFVFSDPAGLWIMDDEHSLVEQRQKIIGDSEKGILVVVFTSRGSSIRIISARRASRVERRLYEEKIER
jgi:uncharacterized DUF497 family protein